MSILFKICQKYFAAHGSSDNTGECDIGFLRFQVQSSLSLEVVFIIGLVSALLETFAGPCKNVSHRSRILVVLLTSHLCAK